MIDRKSQQLRPTAGSERPIQIGKATTWVKTCAGSPVCSERTRAGLRAARERGRTGGRPPALSTADLAAAKAMLRDPQITVNEVAKRLKVSPATLYRHLPGGRSGLDGSGGKNAQKEHRD